MTKVCSFCGVTYPDANVFCPADGTTLRAADAEGDLVGSVVADRYLVTDLLGEGGMGRVFRARHVRLPQEAAIKVLHATLVQDPGAVARLKSEASNASRISHDRVARVYDFGETGDGTVYLAMEYVPGRTLRRLLADGPLEPARAAALVRQIAEGLDAAHRLGIVHRDLKPDNVMVVDDGDGVERVKIVDFGIAKALTADAGEARTRTGFVVGTPEFMSPEQLVGTGVDARSDVYALALVAYQCLTGALPFDTGSPERTITARLTEPPRPLRALAPDVAWPAAVQDAMDAALARDPESRPATAGAFARRLEQAVRDWLAASTPAASPSAALAAAMPPAPPRATPPLAGTSVDARPVSPAAPEPAPVAATARSAPARGGRRLVAGAVAAVAAVAVMAVVGWLALGRGAGRAASVAGTDTLPAAPSLASAPPPTSSASPKQESARAAGTVALDEAPSDAAPRAGGTSSSGDVMAPASGAAARGAESTAAPPPAPESPPSDGARVLDSITQALSPDVASPEGARDAIPALRALLPRLRTATDSVWAEIRIADAYLLLQDADHACESLARVRTRTRTAGQRETVQRYLATLGCVL